MREVYVFAVRTVEGLYEFTLDSPDRDGFQLPWLDDAPDKPLLIRYRFARAEPPALPSEPLLYIECGEWFETVARPGDMRVAAGSPQHAVELLSVPPTLVVLPRLSARAHRVKDGPFPFAVSVQNNGETVAPAVTVEWSVAFKRPRTFDPSSYGPRGDAIDEVAYGLADVYGRHEIDLAPGESKVFVLEPEFLPVVLGRMADLLTERCYIVVSAVGRECCRVPREEIDRVLDQMSDRR